MGLNGAICPAIFQSVKPVKRSMATINSATVVNADVNAPNSSFAYYDSISGRILFYCRVNSYSLQKLCESCLLKMAIACKRLGDVFAQHGYKTGAIR